jgi:hypothetical protein
MQYRHNSNECCSKLLQIYLYVARGFRLDIQPSNTVYNVNCSKLPVIHLDFNLLTYIHIDILS